MSNILLVLSAADSLVLADGSTHPTGFWAEEFVVAHRDLLAAGHSVTIATPGGVAPTVDAMSVDASIVGSADKVAELAAYLDSVRGILASPVSLESASASTFAAIVLPGGHGPMTDLARDAALGALLVEANDRGTIIAPFCHGPAALLSADRADGTFAFDGRRLAAFTDEEELTGGLGDKSPWFVSAALSERGVVLDAAPAWSSHVVIDDNLISGQNPQSSEAVARALIEALAK